MSRRLRGRFSAPQPAAPRATRKGPDLRAVVGRAVDADMGGSIKGVAMEISQIRAGTEDGEPMKGGMMDLSQIRAVTFDCYGTLIDWEAGVAGYVAPHLVRAARVGRVVSPEEWIEKWEGIQFGLLVPYRPYKEVLAISFEQTMKAFELESFADGGPGLAHSLAEWPAFGDTVGAIKRMARRRRMGIISNVDEALLAETLGRLLVPLSMTVTAEAAGAYKPDLAPFRIALLRLGLQPHQVLHAAFGWKYDLNPAREVGMKTCFVDRGGKGKPAGYEADFEVPSLNALAELMEGQLPK